MPTIEARVVCPISRTSTPSMVIRPEVGSARRATSPASVLLPDPVWPDQGQRPPGRYLQRHRVHSRCVSSGVGVGDVFEAQFAPDPRRVDRDGMFGFSHVHGQVEVAEDSAEQGH